MRPTRAYKVFGVALMQRHMMIKKYLFHSVASAQAGKKNDMDTVRFPQG